MNEHLKIITIFNFVAVPLTSSCKDRFLFLSQLGTLDGVIPGKRNRIRLNAGLHSF